MAIALEPNMLFVQNRLNISTERMNKYADKSIDEIIQSEAAQGNSAAINYQKEYMGNSDKLIKTLNLDNIGNKHAVISEMNPEQKNKILELLENEDLALGLNFYTQEKLLDLLNGIDTEELVKVLFEKFSLEDIVKQLPEKFIIEFFQNDKVEKRDVVKQMKSLPPEILIQMVEGVTGQPSVDVDVKELIKQIADLPDKKYKDFMENMDPNVLRQLFFQMGREERKYLNLVPNEAYTGILSNLQKPDLVKSCVALDLETLIKMIKRLPDDLITIVATQTDTTKMADLMIEDIDYKELLSELIK